MDNSILLTIVPVVIIVISGIIEKATSCPIKFTSVLLIVYFFVMFFNYNTINLMPSFVVSFISYAAISIIFSTYRKVRYNAPNIAEDANKVIEKVQEELSK